MLLSAVVRLRPIPMRRTPDGQVILSYVAGDGAILAALLRHGPEAALAVSLFTNIGFMAYFHKRWIPHRLLPAASNLFYPPALAYLSGVVYEALGGQHLLTEADCATVFQNPTAILLPLFAAYAVAKDGINRLLIAYGVHWKYGIPLRDLVREPGLSVFYYAEGIGAILALVLWTTWGWSTVPLSFLMTHTLLTAAVFYFSQKEALQQAFTDPLTGLLSPLGLREALQQRFRESRPFALLYLDLDNFKGINDRYGHNVGDDLLRVISSTLRTSGLSVRPGTKNRGLVARRGGMNL
ncbi:MAG: hypothetical protein OHK0029_40700 [Armatimonadaceae bacterium]